MDLNLKTHFEDLVFLPLGGASEIGMNLNLYHLDGKWIMIDCGVGFANDVPGVDMMTADISFIKSHKKNLLGIIITHIHEDHLGAVQYLWEELGVTVYATNFAANFLRRKLGEFGLDKEVPIKIIDSNSKINLGPFNIEFIGLTHSVPEMKALFIKTHKGNILHTGDWKFDPDPVVGELSQKERIKELGDKGEIDVMVCDSTNVMSEGHSRSEGELYESLKSLIEGRKGLVGVTTFASNIARVRTIAKIAKAVGRKIVLAGFSLNRLFEVGKRSGFFEDDFEFISDREIKYHNKSEILVIATGCQGEPNAATKKIAKDIHPTVRFTKGDLMIFSSKIIPGNEKKIFELFNDLARKKIDVMTEKDHFVHVSGHPYKEEVREMYDLAKPRISIPVHGEFLHTKNHCELALESGVQRAIHIENGLAVKINSEVPENTKKIGYVESGYIAIDGRQLLNFDSEIFKERKKLENSGIINISIALNQTLDVVSEIKILSVGSYDLRNDKFASDLLQKEAKIIIRNKKRENKIDEKYIVNFLKKKKNKNVNYDKISKDIVKNIRSKTLKIIGDLFGKRPAVEIFIHIVN